jgi:hypothetical protein
MLVIVVYPTSLKIILAMSNTLCHLLVIETNTMEQNKMTEQLYIVESANRPLTYKEALSFLWYTQEIGARDADQHMKPKG